MIQAVSPAGGLIEASPGGCGLCPLCSMGLIPKCGEIKAWHWSHYAGKDCDTWGEGESRWHLDWKRLVVSGAREVAFGPHRADIVGNGNLVIELQHSSLDVREAREREAFYGRMVWLIDATPFSERFEIRDRAHGRCPFPHRDGAGWACADWPQCGVDCKKYGGVGHGCIPFSWNDCLGPEHRDSGYRTFRWYSPRKWLSRLSCPVYLDLGDGSLFRLDYMGQDCPVGGWGYLVPKARFISSFLSAVILPTDATRSPAPAEEAVPA